jgi:hypothetical protein
VIPTTKIVSVVDDVLIGANQPLLAPTPKAMQSASLRLASRHGKALVAQSSRRTLATTAAPADVAAAASSSSSLAAETAKPRTQNLIPISNVEAQWANMSREDKYLVHQQLEEVMKKDWKLMSLDEKKAGECRFGLCVRW